jgi:hypothetical protein
LIDLSGSPYAALPQNSPEHLPDLFQAHRSVLDQTDHHSHMLDQLGIVCSGQSGGDLHRARRLLRLGRSFGLLADQDRGSASAGFILVTLQDPALLSAIELNAPPCGLLASMGLSATKRTAQVAPPGIAGMGEKKDPTMPATAQAFAQVRLGPQARSQEHVILRNQRGHCGRSIPARPEFEKLRDPYCKKPKLSLRVLT